MKHSKLPFRRFSNTGRLILDADGNNVCELLNPKNQRANSQFIVTACNNYEKMLEALKSITNINHWEKIYPEIAEAIKQAEAEK